jgi:hypothetical protein
LLTAMKRNHACRSGAKHRNTRPENYLGKPGNPRQISPRFRLEKIPAKTNNQDHKFESRLFRIVISNSGHSHEFHKFNVNLTLFRVSRNVFPLFFNAFASIERPQRKTSLHSQLRSMR